MCGQRHRAAAPHGAADGALCRHTQPGAGIGQRGQRGNHVGALAAHFNAQRALACSGQHVLRREHGANAFVQPQALEAGCGQHDGGVLPFVELAQPGVEVAAQWLNAQVGAQRLQQGLAAQAGGAHHCALGQLGQTGVARRHQGIARVFTLQHTGQGEAAGQLHGHVFERMHGQVGAAFFQGHFQLFDKQAFAAHLGQGAVQNLVALGGHAQQRHLVTLRLQQGANMLGLPQGQAAFTGGDGQVQGSAHKVKEGRCGRA